MSHLARLAAATALIAMTMLSVPASAMQSRDDDDDDARPSKAPSDIVVTARRLDAARATVEPSLGASVYTLDNETVESRPGGETTSIAQILLQAPGVAQTGSGSIAVRGATGGIQYRINNVILPDGIADLGERLSPRLAERVDLITGALPAQYGLQAGDVVNIATKNGIYQQGGQAEVFGGSGGRLEPAVEIAGGAGKTSYFATASYLRDTIGLGAPDGSASPRHDRTDQIEGLAFIDHTIDGRSRLSLLLGSSNEHFQIPEVPGGTIAADPFNPIDAGSMRTNSQYATLSYLQSDDGNTLQLSLFGRYGTDRLQPGASAGLVPTGLGGSRRDRDWMGGVQIEDAITLGEHHMIRLGGVADYRALHSRFALATMAPGTTAPLPLDGSGDAHRTDTSLFVQGEWKLTSALTANIGGRVDHIAGAARSTGFGPRASLVWQAGDGITFHAGYARLLIAPSVNPAAPASVLSGAAAVRPRAERDDYIDIGVQRKSGGLTLSLDAFRRAARDLIGGDMSGSPLVARDFNYRRGRFTGAEASATYADGPFTAWANLAYVRARATGLSTGQSYFAPAAIAYVETHWVIPGAGQTYTGSAGMSYRLGKLQATASLLYGSGQQRMAATLATVPGHLPSYVQADAALTYRLDGLGDRPLDFRIDLINLADRRYQISSDGRYGIPEWGPRRGVFAGLEQAF